MDKMSSIRESYKKQDVNGAETSASSPAQQHHDNEEQEESILYICKLIAGRPVLVFVCLLILHSSFMVITGIMVLVGYDILPVDFTGVPLTLEKDESFLRVLAWRNRNTKDILLKSTETMEIQRQSRRFETLLLIYKGFNVFSKRNLKSIVALEKSLTSTPEYSSVCHRVHGECTKPLSIARLFDGTFGPAFNDSTFSNIPMHLQNAIDNPVIKEQINFILGKGCLFDVSQGLVDCSITRSLIYFGMPLSSSGNEEDDLKILEEYFRSMLMDKLNTLHESGYENMEFYFYSDVLFRIQVEKQVNFDLVLALGSLLFIFMFMVFQTHSLFITLMSIYGILTSFLAANMVYRIVFDYKFFGIFHVLSIFIILGIGADDVFVFYDTWRAIAHEKCDRLEKRLSECYKRASSAMLITSLTTMVAFISNALSPLLPISSFGIFSATLVFISFLTAITFYPSVIIIHHLYFEKRPWPCLKYCKRPKARLRPIQTTTVTPLSIRTNDPATNDEQMTRKNIVVGFFFNYYFKFVTHVYVRWVLVFGFLATITVFTFFAKDLKTDEESTKIFKSQNNFRIAKNLRSNAFLPSNEDGNIRVYLIWGLKNQDRSSCHKTNQKCTGKTVWDESIDLNPKPAQVELKKFCEYMMNMEGDLIRKLRIRKNSVTKKLEVKCFVEEFEDFLKKEGRYSRFNGVPFSIPVTELMVMKIFADHPELYNITGMSPTFYRYFETSLSYWLQNGYRDGNRINKYEDIIGFSRDKYDTRKVLNESGKYYGTRLRYVAIVVNTTVMGGNLGYKEGMPIYEAWEEFFQKKIKDLPPSLSGGFQCTPEGNNDWHWFKVGKVLADSATQGVGVGICLSFFVLTLATQNIIVGFLATITIGFVTVTIVGIIPMVGWKLGVLESVNLSLVVGLSVDYVVHLAEGYNISKHSDRKDKVRDMLEMVAVSVVSGATSSLGAALFMLFAQILFFVQFGIFLFCTTAFSFLYSIGLFTTLLGILGPENNIGSLKPVWRICHNLVTGRKNEDKTCKQCKGAGFVKKRPEPSMSLSNLD